VTLLADQSLGWLPALLDYLGVATFAMVSTVAARDRELDLISTMFLGTVAGIGGGTVRDVIINQPVFWTQNPTYLFVCIAASALTWFVHVGERRRMALSVMDALGITAFAVVGALKATTVQLPAAVAVAMGIVTATCGGVLRDLLAVDKPVLVRKDVYITAALVAAGGFVLAIRLGLRADIAALLATAAGATLRIVAMTRNWQLPAPR
jgi:uncharacterized membrane protein YeiH